MTAPQLHLVTNAQHLRELDALHIGQIEADRAWLRQRLGEVRAQRDAARKSVGQAQQREICVLHQLAKAQARKLVVTVWAFAALVAAMALWGWLT